MHISTPISKHAFLILSVFILGLVSCKKDTVEEVVKGEVKVKLVNAVYNESKTNVFFDNLKITNSSLAFGESSDYFKVASGSKMVSFVNESSTSTQNILNFTPSLVYTTYLIADRTGSKELISYEDNLSNTEIGKAKIRLANLSPYFSTGINVSVEAGTQFVNGLMYKEFSNYFTVDAGLNLRFNVVGSGNIKTILGTALEAGKIYTIWFSGTNTTSLEAHIVTNN